MVGSILSHRLDLSWHIRKSGTGDEVLALDLSDGSVQRIEEPVDGEAMDPDCPFHGNRLADDPTKRQTAHAVDTESLPMTVASAGAPYWPEFAIDPVSSFRSRS